VTGDEASGRRDRVRALRWPLKCGAVEHMLAIESPNSKKVLSVTLLL